MSMDLSDDYDDDDEYDDDYDDDDDDFGESDANSDKASIRADFDQWKNILDIAQQDLSGLGKTPTTFADEVEVLDLDPFINRISAFETTGDRLQNKSRGFMDTLNRITTAKMFKRDQVKILRFQTNLVRLINNFSNKFGNWDRQNSPMLEQRLGDMQKAPPPVGLDKIKEHIGDLKEWALSSEPSLKSSIEQADNEKFRDKFDKYKSRTEKIVQKYNARIGQINAPISRMNIAESRDIQHMIETIASLRSKIGELESYLRIISETIEEKKDAQSELCGLDLHIRSPPCVTIFKLKPPPSVNLAKLSTVRNVQAHVGQAFSMFKYPAVNLKPEQSACSTHQLTRVQELTYHYMQPYNKNLNVMIVHSVGAGKTGTAMLISSIFARAGFTPLFVTKQDLLPLYLSSAFNTPFDFNIQQYLKQQDVERLRDVPDVQQAIEQGIGEQKAINAHGLQVWHDMGIYYSEKHCKLTYKQFSNLAVAAEGRSRWTLEPRKRFFRANAADKKRGHRDDPVANCIVVVDEAHQMVVKGGDLKDAERGDYLSMLKLLWESRRLSGEHAARVVLLTATPIVDSPVDLINLANLMVAKDEAIPLLTDSEMTNMIGQPWPAVKRRMEANFNRKFTDSKTGRLVKTERLKHLLRGRVSVFKFAGDPSRFAQPNLHWENVTLTRMQENTFEKCMDNANLKYNRLKGMWKMADSKRGLNAAKITSCILQSSIWPQDPVLKPRGDKKITDTKKKSTVIYRLLRKIKQNREQSIGNLDLFYRSSSPVQRMKHMKQMIYTAGTTNREKAYGITVIAEALAQMYGYTILNKLNRSEWDTVRPYHGILIGEKDGKEVLDDAVDYFNAKDNVDGRKAFMFVTNVKEGISLYDVRYASLVGFMPQRADMIQAVGRAIRMCRSTHLPFRKGWTIDVDIYTPDFSKTGKFRDAKRTMRELFERVIRTSAKSATTIREMQALMEDCAYDRDLLKTINDRSAQVEANLQFSDPNARKEYGEW